MNDRFDELNIDVRTKEGLGSDYWYHKLLKSPADVEKYDFHSDYWGSDYEYRENAEEIMEDIAVYIDTPVILDETGTPVKLLGLLVDKQYSGHLDLLVEPIKEVNSSKKIRSSKKAASYIRADFDFPITSKNVYDYLYDEIGVEMVDSVYDCGDYFDVTVETGGDIRQYKLHKSDGTMGW